MQKSVFWRKHGLVLFNPSIWPLSGATTPGQSVPGSDANKEVFRIPLSYIITGISSSDCLVSYPEHSSASREVLPLCREAVGVFYSPSRLSKLSSEIESVIGVQILDLVACVSLRENAFGKGMNPSVLPNLLVNYTGWVL